MDKQTQKTAVVSAGTATFVILAFVLGMKLMGTSSAPEIAATHATEEAPPPLTNPQPELLTKPTATQDGIVDRLISVEEALQKSRADMNKATTNNKGGYVEKARADLTQAVEHITAAVDYAKNHADIVQLPAPDPLLDITAQVQVAQGGRAATAPNLRTALDSLQTALAQLHKTPGGDLGGFRDKTLIDIKTAADDISAGYEIASGGRNPGAVARLPVPPPPAAIGLNTIVPTATPDKYKPLRFATAPDGGSDLALTNAQRMLSPRLPDINNPAAVEVLPPMRTVLLSPRQLGTLDMAQENGIAYFIRVAGTITAQCELRQDAIGAYRSSSIASGNARLLEIDPAFQAILASPQVKQGSYEPRILTSGPPIPLFAFWLVSEKGDADLVYPLSAPSGVETKKLYTADEFIKAFKASRQVQLLTGG